MSSSLTNKDVKIVARIAIKTLEKGGYRCCVFGSLACTVWGMDRVPKDVDIVVFSPQHDPEQIKEYLVDNNNSFFLKDPKEPDAKYKVLHFNFYGGQRRTCKVDILVSGRFRLHIPRIPEEHVAHPNGPRIPVVPFFVLIVLKVQGWRDHHLHRFRKPWFWKKIPQDIEDINQLLGMIDDRDHLDHFDWLPKWFQTRAKSLVRRYTKKHPETVDSFRKMGFEL